MIWTKVNVFDVKENTSDWSGSLFLTCTHPIGKHFDLSWEENSIRFIIFLVCWFSKIWVDQMHFVLLIDYTEFFKFHGLFSCYWAFHQFWPVFQNAALTFSRKLFITEKRIRKFAELFRTLGKFTVNFRPIPKFVLWVPLIALSILVGMKRAAWQVTKIIDIKISMIEGEEPSDLKQTYFFKKTI